MQENNLKAVDAVSMFKDGSLRVADYNREYIDRATALNPELHAWAYLDPEQWLAAAEARQETVNSAYSTLAGIPVGIKDIFNTADMPTSMGSTLWEGFTPGNDARVVYNVKMQQGIVAGKTVTAEFAVHAPNETRNPWDSECSPGTSSSGSAAAVASRMVPLSLGTQTAGSIIRPASYCGVYGFKPTFGTTPRTGMLKTTDTLDTIGLFGTNADDCGLLFDVIRVHGLDYPMVNRHLDAEGARGMRPGAWRVGVIADQHFTAQFAESYAASALQDFVRQLGAAGATTSYPELSALINRSHEVQETIYHKSLSYYFSKEFEEHTLISPEMYRIIAEGQKISGQAYQDGIREQSAIATAVDSLFDEVDIIITLSTSATAPSFGTAIDIADTCLLWTMCGLPAMSVPAFMHNGMPFGLQVLARKYDDYKLLNFVRFLNERGLAAEFSAMPDILTGKKQFQEPRPVVKA